MATDLRYVIPNQPGRLARFLAALAAEGINLDGISGEIRPGETWGVMHILVSDPDRAAAVMEREGIELTARHEVDICEVENRPGAIGDELQRYYEAGENVEMMYTLTGNRFVVATESMRQPIEGVSMKDAKYT